MLNTQVWLPASVLPLESEYRMLRLFYMDLKQKQIFPTVYAN